MLNVCLKMRQILNKRRLGLAIHVEDFLKKKLGFDFKISSFKIIHMSELSRFIKINVNGEIYRVNIFTKKEWVDKEFYWLGKSGFKHTYRNAVKHKALNALESSCEREYISILGKSCDDL